MIQSIINRQALRAIRRGNTSAQLDKVRCISSSQLTINSCTTDIPDMPPKEELTFGKTFAPHMLQIHYVKDKGGWQSPEIIPFQDLKISPAAAALHYGLECFEGMKAYKTTNDSSDLRLFRPDLNMKRLKDSMHRLSMPGCDFDTQEMINCIGKLVRLDKDWIPEGEGYSLYLRPTAIATNRCLGLAPPDDLLLYVITSPVGPYFTSGFDPLKLTADTEYVRAWPGGSGASKVGGNYAPTMKPGAEALLKGYSQILWVFGEDQHVTEVGSMNVFFLFEKEDGTKELATPPLTRGDILPGVTRQSIIELCKQWGEFDVSERAITMSEIEEMASKGRLLEAFGAGTAAVVTPISHIQYKGIDIEIPATGELTKRIFHSVMDIQYGKTDSPWSVKI